MELLGNTTNRKIRSGRFPAVFIRTGGHNVEIDLESRKSPILDMWKELMGWRTNVRIETDCIRRTGAP